MEIETVQGINLRQPKAYPYAAYDLPLLIGKLKQSHSWAMGELNNMILLNSPEKQIVLTALHKKTEVESFQKSDSISFQIIEGEVRFSTRQESLHLKQGQLLTLSEKVKYSFTADEETVLLLTISNFTAKGADS